MKGYMYILECADGTYYTGSTIDLAKRLWEHENFMGANYTKKKNPVKLVYSEEFDRIDEAFAREKQVQGWSHAKKQALIDQRPHLLPDLSKNYTQYGKPVTSTSSVTEDVHFVVLMNSTSSSQADSTTENRQLNTESSQPDSELVEGAATAERIETTNGKMKQV